MLTSELQLHFYYPFGMMMEGRSFSSEGYRFGFNGKEKDDEVKGNGRQYDYGFRIYDPRLVRFLSIDPGSLENMDFAYDAIGNLVVSSPKIRPIKSREIQNNVHNGWRTRAQKKEIILQWQQSEKSRKEFCAEQGVNYNSLVGWCKQFIDQKEILKKGR